jgi:hypothetical protein
VLHCTEVLRQTVELGQFLPRHFMERPAALPHKAAASTLRHRGSYGPIVLQKSKVAGRLIFREITKQEAIADSYNLNRVTEVTCEFDVRRRGPPHLYTKVAPVARRIFDHQCKTTFATVSATNRHILDGRTL